MKEDTFSFDVDISDDFIEEMNKLFEIKENEEYVVGLDCGNGKSIQVKGHFKVNTNALYKRKKVGKRYKFYKTYSFPFSEMTFIGNEIIHIKEMR